MPANLVGEEGNRRSMGSFEESRLETGDRQASRYSTDDLQRARSDMEIGFGSASAAFNQQALDRMHNARAISEGSNRSMADFVGSLGGGTTASTAASLGDPAAAAGNAGSEEPPVQKKRRVDITIARSRGFRKEGEARGGGATKRDQGLQGGPPGGSPEG